MEKKRLVRKCPVTIKILSQNSEEWKRRRKVELEKDQKEKDRKERVKEEKAKKKLAETGQALDLAPGDLIPVLKPRAELKKGFEMRSFDLPQDPRKLIPILGNGIKMHSSEFIFPESFDEIEDFLLENVPDIRVTPDDPIVHFYSPSLKIGVYLLGIMRDCASAPKGDWSQKSRLNNATDKGMRLVQILEDEWFYKKPIVKAKLSAIFKINNRTTVGPRKCKIKEITAAEAKLFFENNHIQGYVCAGIKYGLFFQEELVAAMTFRKSKNKVELSRYATKIDLSIPGGFNKLLKFILKELPENYLVYTFADLRWSRLEDSIYYKNNFIYKYSSDSNYFYYHGETGYKKMSRNRFQKHKLKDCLESFDETLTEFENMFYNGYMRVTDCGNLKFILPRS